MLGAFLVLIFKESDDYGYFTCFRPHVLQKFFILYLNVLYKEAKKPLTFPLRQGVWLNGK